MKTSESPDFIDRLKVDRLISESATLTKNVSRQIMNRFRKNGQSGICSAIMRAAMCSVFISFQVPNLCAGYQEATQSESRKVVVTISVDWEGMHLNERNLQAFEKFRERFPEIPLTHFLNAAYYLREESSESVTKKIRRVVKDRDETALHIHCWKSLVEKSGVKYKAGPTFWSEERLARKNANGDEGHEVEMAAYSAEEVEKMAKTAREILEKNGFEITNSFRAAGWVASKDVLKGIRAAGFTVDSSATDRSWHEDEIGKFKIYERMGELWPKVTQHSQPYTIQTESGTIVEMPDTAALADYITADEMDIHIKEVLDKSTDETIRFVHIGFHQETSARYLSRIEKCLAKWQDNKYIEFQVLKKAAETWEQVQQKKK